MTDHERVVLLAAAAIDFPLTPSEAKAMDEHLRTCEPCRLTVARLRDDAASIAALPIRRPSGIVEQRIVEAVTHRRAAGYRRSLVLAVAALLLAMALVGATLAGAAFLRATDPSVLQVRPSPADSVLTVYRPSPKPSAASPSTDVGQRTFATSCGPVTPDASAAFTLPVLAPDSTALVLVDGLRIRSAPVRADCSRLLEPLLQGSEQLFVIGGPVVASDYEWYRVEPIGPLDAARPAGWVARASREGRPWVAPADPSCPAVEPSPSALARLNPGFILACLRDRELRFDARLAPCPCDAAVSSPIAGFVADLQNPPPARLIDPIGGRGRELPLLLASDAVVPDPLPVGELLSVTGHFDDPSSAACGWRDGSTADNDDPVLTCRTAFVVTGIAP